MILAGLVVFTGIMGIYVEAEREGRPERFCLAVGMILLGTLTGLGFLP